MLQKKRVGSFSKVWVFETILDQQIISLDRSLIVKLKLNFVNREYLAMSPRIQGLMFIIKIIKL